MTIPLIYHADGTITGATGFEPNPANSDIIETTATIGEIIADRLVVEATDESGDIREEPDMSRIEYELIAAEVEAPAGAPDVADLYEDGETFLDEAKP